MFLLVLTVLTVFVTPMCVIYVVSYIHWSKNNNASVNLFVYHTRLVLSDITTKEDNTKRFNTPFGNPYYKRNYWKDT